jgi:hypothetical protein
MIADADAAFPCWQLRTDQLVSVIVGSKYVSDVGATISVIASGVRRLAFARMRRRSEVAMLCDVRPENRTRTLSSDVLTRSASKVLSTVTSTNVSPEVISS